MQPHRHQHLDDDDIDIVQPSDDDQPAHLHPIDISDQSPSSLRSWPCLRTVLCSRLGLLVLVTGYTLLGALVFRTLEGGGRVVGSAAVAGLPQHVQQSREECLRELWTITERLNVLYEKNWTRLVTQQLKRFERAVIESRNIDGITSPQGWTFYGSLLYSITLLTTIGHGRLSPKTAMGKIVAIIYACVGVPLMLVLLSSFGSVLAGGARKGYARICCKHKDRSTHKSNNSIVGYRPAPSGKHGSSYDDSSIQISTPSKQHLHTTSFNRSNTNNSSSPRKDLQEFHLPRKAVLLATIRAPHHHNAKSSAAAAARCNGGGPPVQQMGCSAGKHSASGICANHAAHSPGGKLQEQMVMVLDDAGGDDPDEHIVCSQHTPSRVPLIYRPPERFQSSPSPSSPSSPPLSPTIIVPNNNNNNNNNNSVPVSLVVAFLLGYLCFGAVVFAVSTNDNNSTWKYLDAAYLCFIALTTIGLDDRLALLLTEPPSSFSGSSSTSSDQIRFSAQLQMLAFCLYVSVGLILIAMSFSLVQDELTQRYRTVLGDRQQNSERKCVTR